MPRSLTARTVGAIVVAYAGRTRVDAVEQSLAELAKVKGRVLGLVLNAVPSRGADADAYGAHYGGYYQAEPDLQFPFEEQPAPTRTRRSERAR